MISLLIALLFLIAAVVIHYLPPSDRKDDK